MHLIGLFALWLSAAALVWLSVFWAPPHIARFQDLGMSLPGLTVAAVAIGQWVQAWAFPIAGAVIVYSVVHLILLRSLMGLLTGLAAAALLAIPAALVFIGITVANHEIAKALS